MKSRKNDLTKHHHTRSGNYR